MTATADEFHRLKLMAEGAIAMHFCCKDLEHVAEALRIAERVKRPGFMELRLGLDAHPLRHELISPEPA